MTLKWIMLSLLLIFSGLSMYVVIDMIHRDFTRHSPLTYKPNALSMELSRIPLDRGYDYNWTIVLSVNEGFRDFFLNWWRHFQRLGIKVPIVVEAEDDIVFSKLRAKFQTDVVDHVTIERSPLASIPNSSTKGSVEYNKLVRTRPTHILKYLRGGRNVFYSDIDTVWLKNPFPYFKGNYDLWIAQGLTRYCTGFMAIISNSRTKKLMKDWEQNLNKKLQANQPIFNTILHKSNVLFKPLDAELFPHGIMFNNFTFQRRSHVVVMHNTWVDGHTDKLERFKKFHVWFDNLNFTIDISS